MRTKNPAPAIQSSCHAPSPAHPPLPTRPAIPQNAVPASPDLESFAGTPHVCAVHRRSLNSPLPGSWPVVIETPTCHLLAPIFFCLRRRGSRPPQHIFLYDPNMPCPPPTANFLRPCPSDPRTIIVILRFTAHHEIHSGLIWMRG